MSKVRLSAKSTPSKTGGPSSNSGTDWPGTNSARWIRISIVEGARRTRTPRWWHWSTSSTASSCGKSGSAMMTSSMRSVASTLSRSPSEPSGAAPLPGSALRREEADDLDRRVRRVAERVSDVARCACPCRRAPRGAGSRRRAASRRSATRSRARNEETIQQIANAERALEEVVAGEVFAADDGEEQRDDGDLEQRADDPREPGRSERSA